MKRILLLLAVVVASGKVFAQTNPMAVGPYLQLIGGGTNAAPVPNSYKTGVALTIPTAFGASFYLPFSKTQNFGASFDLGYQSYGIVQRPYDNATDNNTYEYRYHYLAISPNIVASAFLLGFTFGVPLGMNKADRAGNVSLDYGSETMVMQIDVHLGACIPLYSDTHGRFDLLVVGSYGVTGMTSSTPGDVTLKDPKSAALMIGFNYLYALEH